MNAGGIKSTAMLPLACLFLVGRLASCTPQGTITPPSEQTVTLERLGPDARPEHRIILQGSGRYHIERFDGPQGERSATARGDIGPQAAASLIDEFLSLIDALDLREGYNNFSVGIYHTSTEVVSFSSDGHLIEVRNNWTGSDRSRDFSDAVAAMALWFSDYSQHPISDHQAISKFARRLEESVLSRH